MHVVQELAFMEEDRDLQAFEAKKAVRLTVLENIAFFLALLQSLF